MGQQFYKCMAYLYCVLIIILSSSLINIILAEGDGISAVGDPGMRRDGLRVAIEAWNQCNEVGREAPHMGSPRQADCFDLHNSSTSSGDFYFPTPTSNFFV